MGATHPPLNLKDLASNQNIQQYLASIKFELYTTDMEREREMQQAAQRDII